MYFFCPQKFSFCPQPIFYSLFLNYDGRIEKIVLLSCIIDFDYVQVSLRRISLSLIACKVMKAFSIFSGQILKKTSITLQAIFIQTCISLKSKMQLTKTIFSDSVIFIEKNRAENHLLEKVNFCGQFCFIHLELEKSNMPDKPGVASGWNYPCE